MPGKLARSDAIDPNVWCDRSLRENFVGPAALAAAKQRVVRLGVTGAERAIRYKAEAMAWAVELAPVLRDLKRQGVSLRGMAADGQPPGADAAAVACGILTSWPASRGRKRPEMRHRLQQGERRSLCGQCAASHRADKASGATSLRGIAKALNARGIATARGGVWTPVQVTAVLRRAS